MTEKEEDNKIRIEIRPHDITPNQETIELIDEGGLIAKIIPKRESIAIISKYLEGYNLDTTGYPPKLTVDIGYYGDYIEITKKIIKNRNAKKKYSLIFCEDGIIIHNKKDKDVLAMKSSDLEMRTAPFLMKRLAKRLKDV